jgi:hypothetical protein
MPALPPELDAQVADLTAKAKALNELTNILIVVAAAVALVFVWTP